jgi:hypothetical protein
LREVELGIDQRRADALARFADGGVRKADEREAWQASIGDVHLDADVVSIDSDEGESAGDGKHARAS